MIFCLWAFVVPWILLIVFLRGPAAGEHRTCGGVAGPASGSQRSSRPRRSRRGGADRGAADRGGAALLLQQVPDWSQRPAARRDAGESLVSQTDEMTETQTAAARSLVPSGWTPAPLLNPVLQNPCPSPEPTSSEPMPLSRTQFSRTQLSWTQLSRTQFSRTPDLALDGREAPRVTCLINEASDWLATEEVSRHLELCRNNSELRSRRKNFLFVLFAYWNSSLKISRLSKQCKCGNKIN